MPSRLQSSLDRASRVAKLAGGSILVGLSGGKDSLVTLDVCKQTFARVEAFSMYLCKGIRCFEMPVEHAAAKYEVPLHWVPHWDLARITKYAVLRPHVSQAEKLPEMKLRDVERFLAKKTGISWFAYGERATDSMTRRLHHRRVDGIHDRGDEGGKLAPIWDWVDADVYAYMRHKKIPTHNRRYTIAIPRMLILENKMPRVTTQGRNAAKCRSASNRKSDAQKRGRTAPLSPECRHRPMTGRHTAPGFRILDPGISNYDVLGCGGVWRLALVSVAGAWLGPSDDRPARLRVIAALALLPAHPLE